jgi:acyl dehydratase
VYLSQSLKFIWPVKLDDTVTARVEVAEALHSRNRVRLQTQCVNGSGQVVLAGEAWVMPARAVQRGRIADEPPLQRAA